MKGILVITFSIVLFYSCEHKTEIDYCKMLELDGSYVNSDTTNMDQFNSDRLKRHNLIKENFRALIQFSSQNGFPEMGSLKATGLDSCRNWAVMITLFHIGQIEPQLLFEERTVELFKEEIANGNLRNGSLFAPIREGFEYHEFCESDRDQIFMALNSWQLNKEELPSIRFKECLN